MKCNIKSILRIAGAFVALLIGSGFSTGQETLRFFSSYSYASYGVVIFNLIGFIILGQILLAIGNEHKDVPFDHFSYYCGKKLGKLYSWLLPAALFLIISVLISATGSTLYEYYGLNRYVGSAFMALLVVITYLIGFEKLVKIVSFIGPAIIIFTIFVGIVTVMNDYGNLSEITQYKESLEHSKASPSWILSAVLYLSLCFLTASTYYTALGRSAINKDEARLGAALGGVIFVLALAVMNTAILLNAKDTSILAIPTLFLASKISSFLGGIFSVLLILGMFSSCSTMMWSVCSTVYADDVLKNRIFAVSIGIMALILGRFPFSKLVGMFYPFIGYSGLLFISCVAWKEINKKYEFL